MTAGGAYDTCKWHDGIATVAVCALEWRSAIADAVVETHDRIVGKTWREAKRACDARADDAKAALKDALQGFSNFGSALLFPIK